MLHVNGMPLDDIKAVLRLRSKEHARQHVAKGACLVRKKLDEKHW